MAKTALLYVQHLWGVGHVYRATRIAHGMRDAGFDVHVVWGGTKLPDFDFSGLQVHYLPSVRTSDASFKQLLHSDGRVFSQADQDDRKEALLAIYCAIKPDVLITEAFPFGRRQMQFELLPLMELADASSPRPLIVSSIRDIMQEDRKPKRVEESNALVSRFFDLVLVHGDPAMVRIEDTLQGAEAFHEKIRYTGLVTPSPTVWDRPKQDQHAVLVSVGGGAFGKDLLACAIEAKPLCANPAGDWLIATGSQLPENEFREVSAQAPPGTKIVRHISDMVSALRSARVSLSHAGYNTVADILVARCSAVLYPYSGGCETEQLRRARIMEKLGIAKIIEPDMLSPGALARAIGSATGQAAASHTLDLDGASRTGHIVNEALTQAIGR